MQNSVYKRLFIFLSITLINLSKCSLEPNEDILAPKRNHTYNTLNSTHVVETHLVGTSLPSVYNLSTYSLQMYFPANSSYPSKYFTLNTTITSPAHKVRSFRTNTYHLQSGSPDFSVRGIFLQIQNSRVSVCFDSLIDPIVIYDTSINKSSSTAPHNSSYNENVEDCYFLTTYNEVVLIISTSAGYVIKYVYLSISTWKNAVVAGTTDVLLPITQVNVGNTEIYCRKMEHNRLSNKIFLIFSLRFICYSADYLLQYCGSWTMNKKYMWYDLDISTSQSHTDLVALMYGTFIYIVNATKFSSITGWSPIYYTQNYLAQSVKLEPPYIFVSVLRFSTLYYTQITQIDFTINYNSSTGLYVGYEIQRAMLNYFINNGQMDMLVNSKIVNYHKFMFTSNKVPYDVISLFTFTPHYSCQGCTCLPTYILLNNSNICTKNYTPISMSQHVTPVIPLPFFMISQQQTSFNSVDSPQVSQHPSLISQINQSKTLNQIFSIIARVLPFTCMRITPQFLSSLIIALDDFWYYKYHKLLYPQSAQLFMQKVDIMNVFRHLIFQENTTESSTSTANQKMQTEYLLLGLISAEQFYKNVSWLKVSIPTQQNEIYLAHFQQGQNYHTLPDFIYFMNTNLDIYTNQFLFNILYYTLLKTAQLIVYYFSKKFGIKKMFIYKYIKDNTQIWTLVISIIDVNMVQFAFNCFLQMRLPFHFLFLNKLNFICMVCLFYVLIMYCLLFYVLIFKFEQRKNKLLKNYKKKHAVKKESNNGILPSEIILLRTYGFANYKPYLYESLSIVSRNFLRSFVHSYYLQSYKIQISLLVLIDLYSISLALRYCQYHKTKLNFCLTLLYYLLLFAFDCFFMVKQFYSQNSYFEQYQQQFSLIVLCCVLATVLLTIIADFILWICECFKSIKKRLIRSEKKTSVTKEIKLTIQRPEVIKIKALRKMSSPVVQAIKNRNKIKNSNLIKIVNSFQDPPDVDHEIVLTYKKKNKRKEMKYPLGKF